MITSDDNSEFSELLDKARRII